MRLLNMLSGKSEEQLAVLDLLDVFHTLKKNEVSKTNTQNGYAMEVAAEAIEILKKHFGV